MERMCGVDAITELINHGLDLKRRYPPTGETLLHSMASRSRNFTEEDSLPIVQLLVEKGADLLARDNVGFTPLLLAADDQNDDVIHNFIQHSLALRNSRHLWNSFHWPRIDPLSRFITANVWTMTTM